jgi:hypothetical protein
MNETFEKRVQAAATAGWCVVLIAVGVLLLQWIAYLFIMNARPEWIRTMWGPDIAWSFIQTVWFWIMAIFKLLVGLLALAALWLTLWAKQLRKHGR